MTQTSTHNGQPISRVAQTLAALVAVLLFLPALAHATPYHQLCDIVPGRGGSDPKEFCPFNGQVFFQATEATNGAELWVSDTTLLGTVLFANIADDSGGVTGSFPENLTVYNNKLYFSAHDGVNGRDLWVTTGAAGNITQLHVNPGENPNPKELTVANGLLFFAADRGEGVELCYTDGTSIGLIDVNPGAAGSYPADFVVIGTNLFFTADDSVHGREVWMTDGATTTLVSDDIRTGGPSSSPSGLTAFKNNLYFAADDGIDGSQLWEYNVGGDKVQMIKSLTAADDFALPSRLTAVGDTLFMASRGDNAGAHHGMELWWTNGTVGSLSPTADIFPGAEGSNPSYLTAFNGAVVFSAASNGYDNELWRSDGTPAGTWRIMDINHGAPGSNPGPFFAYRSQLYFAAETALQGRELWSTDGTAGSAVIASNINPDSPAATGSDPAGFVEARGRMIFAATTADSGREPWIYDFNTNPVITEGASVPVTMSKDGAPTPFSLTLHATDADSDTLTWSIGTAASHGTATASGTGNAKVIGYTPATHYTGGDTFAVGVDDGHGGTATCTISVNFATTVPNVVGISQAAAGTALTGASLTTGTVTKKYSGTVAAGLVISQAPTAGQSVPYSSAVNLVVSKGPAPPITGSIAINGDHLATNNALVTLSLTWAGGDGSGVTRMRFSDNGATWTDWTPVSATASHTLLAGDGSKTVRVQYLDSMRNKSVVFSDSILLDTTPPTGTIVINDGAGTTTTPSVTLKLTWADAGAGVTRMRFSDNGSTWTAWMPLEAVHAYTLPAGLGNHTVRVQYLDAVSNYSAVYNDYILLAP